MKDTLSLLFRFLLSIGFIVGQEGNVIHISLEGIDPGHFVGPVHIGGQPFKVIFDTGGFGHWVASRRAIDEVLLRSKNKYISYKSADSKYRRRKKTLKYVKSSVTGELVEDTLNLGEHSLKSFLFLEAVQMTGGHHSNYDGVFGLQNCIIDQTFEPTIPEALFSCDIIKKGVFTFRFCGKVDETGLTKFTTGDLVFGEIRENFQMFKPVYVPIVRQWEIPVDKMTFMQTEVVDFVALLDTGSTLIVGSESKVTEIFNSMGILEVNAGWAVVMCDQIRHYPPLKITLAGRTFLIPAHKFFMQSILGPEFCKFTMKFIPEVKSMRWKFGMPMLQNFHTIFDWENRKIGISEVNC